MFPVRFFSLRYWAARYWAKVGAESAGLDGIMKTAVVLQSETRTVAMQAAGYTVSVAAPAYTVEEIIG